MIKKTASLTLAFSGIVLLLSSVVLYVGPPSHVGHFSPWLLLGLSRHHWGAIHLNGGILFCIAMLVHTYYNWKLLLSYMKRKRNRTHSLVPLVLASGSSVLPWHRPNNPWQISQRTTTPPSAGCWISCTAVDL